MTSTISPPRYCWWLCLITIWSPAGIAARRPGRRPEARGPDRRGASVTGRAGAVPRRTGCFVRLLAGVAAVAAYWQGTIFRKGPGQERIALTGRRLPGTGR